jgi:hypothetical protein
MPTFASFGKIRVGFGGRRRQKVRHPPAGGTQPPHIAGPLAKICAPNLIPFNDDRFFHRSSFYILIFL